MRFSDLFLRFFGSTNDRLIRRLQSDVERINALEPTLSQLSDDQLSGQTALFRERHANGESLDRLLPEAFATVREAARRTLSMRHFDVQLLGGMVLHKGQIAEMKTGEGKTLVATLPVYLNALSGKGVHVVTVNDYLARRDCEWMGKIYQFLGLSVGVIVPNIDEITRKRAYEADITYGTNNEFGFDYLRDNLKSREVDMVQRDFNFAIVDEVDSILIDEARTPLIISGPVEDSSALYRTMDRIIPRLVEEDYEKDEKQRAVSLTEVGQEHAEALLQEVPGLLKEGGLYDIQNISIVHHINQALRAHKLFTRDVDYICKDGRIIIIDEFTGRMMEGRRYSDGLHQALEAKENVSIQVENQTLAQITFQNYFRMYPKLAGMTGTALTEAGEFDQIYGLGVVDVPTNKPMVRADHDDEVYRTSTERDAALVEEIKECHKRGQPVLVGTVSIERSEVLSNTLSKAAIPHNVLNARQHAQEAQIIAEAGVPGAVTIATNMAGRGTDIQLGGNLDMRLLRLQEEGSESPEEAEKIRAEIASQREIALLAGGLMVIGTERHESRRIDNQLRGRSGRQGDPGASRFYVSLEDDLMRIFGTDRLDGMLKKLGLQEGEAIAHPWVSKALETAQKKVEARNFEIRKQLLKFDDVMNDQRKVVFEQRRDLMRTEDISETIQDMRHDCIDDLVARHIPAEALPDQWNLDGLHTEIRGCFGLDLPIRTWADEEGVGSREFQERITKAADELMAGKAVKYSPHIMRQVERSLLLQLLDHSWKEHLLQLDHLRQGIGLRAYAQRDPLNEYKQEAFLMFEQMLGQLRLQITSLLSHVELNIPSMDSGAQLPIPPARSQLDIQEHHGMSPEDIAALPRANEQDVQMVADLIGRSYKAAPPPPHPSEPAARAKQSAGRKRPAKIDPNDPATWGKVQRNAPCPCGSGKKYKQCHG